MLSLQLPTFNQKKGNVSPGCALQQLRPPRHRDDVLLKTLGPGKYDESLQVRANKILAKNPLPDLTWSTGEWF